MSWIEDARKLMQAFVTQLAHRKLEELQAKQQGTRSSLAPIRLLRAVNHQD